MIKSDLSIIERVERAILNFPEKRFTLMIIGF
jgi:hypothetical protein